ncbi:MAG: tetraacyldisaccharide 4'-kinase [Myxococcales bacterium]|nr:tetraacyldisaccharide 4'-kinase [Myxococcales bacterium]
MNAWKRRLERIWWEGPAALHFGDRVLARVLGFAAWFYALAVRARRRAYRAGLFSAERGAARVLCVGNITVGGSGKTPTAIEVARILRDAGIRVAYVSRGYGRRDRSAVAVVSDGVEMPAGGADHWGDEPVMAARMLSGVPVLVGARRSAVVAEAAARFGAEACVLDDGLQHLGLVKDLSILMVDGSRGFGNGRLLPAGPLRDRLETLTDVQAVCIAKDPEAGLPPAAEGLRGLPTFRVDYQPEGFRDVRTGRPMPLAHAFGTSAWLLAGVANPGPFRDLCVSLGLKILGGTIRGDHHRYTQDDLLELRQVAKEADWVVTTDKDAVKLESLALPPRPIYALSIRAVVEPAEAFRALILGAVR